MKDMKIDDPLERPQDIATLKREGSTSAILDRQAVMTILGEDEGTVVSQILRDDKRNKIVRRREVSSGIELFDQTEGSLKKRTSTARLKFATTDASDVVFTRFKNAVDKHGTLIFICSTLIGDPF